MSGPSARDTLAVVRCLSDTPLANAHARFLERAPARPRVAIPWRDFCARDYPAQALALSAEQTRKLAEGEYAAVALFGQIASGLAMTGAPIDLVSACAAIGGDEIRHADYCLQMAEACAQRPIELSVPRGEVQRECRDAFAVEEVDYLLLKYSAIGESLAVALLDPCERGATDPVARALYANLVRDEVHHARLGWYYFAWRAPRWSQAERQRLADRIAPFVASLELEFEYGRDGESEPARAAAIALGVLDTERQRAALSTAMEEEIAPGLDALGLGGSYVWARRARGGFGPGRRTAPAALVGPRPTDASAVSDVPSIGVAIDRAARFLAVSVAENGQPRFALDPRGECQHRGEMLHGRAAISLRALRAHGGHGAASERLAQWLHQQLRALVAGERPPGIPHDAWMGAGTLALACLAGVPLRQALLDRLPSLPRSEADPQARFHAGQVATALGEGCPAWVFELSCAEVDATPWAPWTAQAAFLRGDQAGWARARDGLLSTLAQDDAGPAALPVAVVAAALEALGPAAATEPALRGPIASACDCLLRLQHGPRSSATLGAFPLSRDEPVLRTDVTAHALLALLACDPARARGSDSGA